MSARDEILSRVRVALRDVPATEAAAHVEVPRDYGRVFEGADPLPMFAERVAEYRATVQVVPADDVRATLTTTLRTRGVRRLAVPHDLPDQWRPDEVELVVDSPDAPVPIADLDRVDGTLTGCALGIALTGTIVLDAGVGQGRRALTLVPDYHLCLVRADQVVGTVPEAMARLDPRRVTTFISGPSATSDIELDRVEGVHGPRTLDVVIVA
jgi:L-lactate dehydrogenase complex protein LldG